MKLSVIVPAYNEGEHIRENLVEIRNTLAKNVSEFEILAVNDGSVDNTKSEISKACELYPEIIYAGYDENRGKGGAVKHGVETASGDVIGFIDADLDISPNHLVSFFNHMNSAGCDIVIGSKMHKDSKLDYPAARKFFSLGYYVLLKILFGMKVHDTQTGVKLYKAQFIKKAVSAAVVKGYAFDIELLALCSHDGAIIEEMPVEIVFKREKSFGRIKFKDIWKMFTDTVGIWWRLKVKRSYFR